MLKMIQLIVGSRFLILCFKKIKIQSSSVEFFLLPTQNFVFKHSLDMELSLEENQNKRLKDCVVQKVQLIKKSKNAFYVEERI